MTYEMTYLAHDEHEDNLLKNRKVIAFRIKEDHSSKSSSECGIELLIKKIKKFMKKNKTKLKQESKNKLKNDTTTCYECKKLGH